jgi:hypothetical protein
MIFFLQTRLNIQEIALPAAGAIAPSAAGAGADDAAAAGEDAAAAAKPKEKTIFTVKLESFDAGSKPKVIKEVKAMVPNLTLIEVRRPFFSFSPLTFLKTESFDSIDSGEKVCRVCAKGAQRGRHQGGCREDQKGLRGARCHRRPRVGTSLLFLTPALIMYSRERYSHLQVIDFTIHHTHLEIVDAHTMLLIIV